MLEIGYGWNHNSTGNDFEARITFDGTILGNALGSNHTHKQEPKDSGGGGGGGTGTNQMYSWSRKFILTVTAGAKILILDYKTQNAGINSSIWNTYYILTKVA